MALRSSGTDAQFLRNMQQCKTFLPGKPNCYVYWIIIRCNNDDPLYKYVVQKIHQMIQLWHFVLKSHSKSSETRINTGFPSSIFLFKLANKILSLYFLVLVLWFYLVLYVFYCPKSTNCTERCYQFVITYLLSLKYSFQKFS